MAKLVPVIIPKVLHPVVVKIDNVRMRAIVLVQLYFYALAASPPRKFFFKLQDVLDGRSTKTVKRLVIVPHNANAVCRSRHFQKNLFLDAVRVLVFINHDVADF